MIYNKWYKDNHARVTKSFILMIQWLAWHPEANEKAELSS